LKGQWLLPGSARRAKLKPRTYHYHHSVTHHDIYVTVKRADLKITQYDKWIPLQEIKRHVPASLVQKALARAAASGDGIERLQPPTVQKNPPASRQRRSAIYR